MISTTRQVAVITGLDLCDEPVASRASKTGLSTSLARYCGRNAVMGQVTTGGGERFLCSRHARVASVFASAITFDGESL